MGLFRRRCAAPTAPPEVEVAGVHYRHHRTASPDPENASHLYLPPDEDPARFRRRVQLDVHTARGLTPATVLGHWLPLHAARHDGPAEINHEVFTANDPFLSGLGAERPALLGRFMDAPVPEVAS